MAFFVSAFPEKPATRLDWTIHPPFRPCADSLFDGPAENDPICGWSAIVGPLVALMRFQKMSIPHKKIKKV
ncbi:MAG: hypothetical protein R6V61_10725 [Wenzhouxiangellaceae bacterium]